MSYSDVIVAAQQPRPAQGSTWAARLGYVRGFANYVSAFDARTEIPPVDLLPHKVKRLQPYLYTEQEIEHLMAAAWSLPICKNTPAGGALKRQTYYCLIGLL